MLYCYDKRKMNYSFEEHRRMTVNNHELKYFNGMMYVRCKIYLGKLHIGL
jgi:hypothetical protein